MKRLHHKSSFKSPIASVTALQADEKRNSLVTAITNNVTVMVMCADHCICVMKSVKILVCSCAGFVEQKKAEEDSI
jgi:hypothetical protein